MFKKRVVLFISFIVMLIGCACHNGSIQNADNVLCQVQGSLDDLSTFVLTIDGRNYYTFESDVNNPWVGYGFSDELSKVCDIPQEKLSGNEQYAVWRNKDDKNKYFLLLSKDGTLKNSVAFLHKDIKDFPPLKPEEFDYMVISQIHEETGVEGQTEEDTNQEHIKEVLTYFMTDGEYNVDDINDTIENYYVIFMRYAKNPDLAVSFDVTQHEGQYYMETKDMNRYVIISKSFFEDIIANIRG